jgi:AraC family transcriptional regulator
MKKSELSPRLNVSGAAAKQVHFFDIQKNAGRPCLRSFSEGHERRLSVWGRVPGGTGQWHWTEAANHSLCLNLHGGNWVEGRFSSGQPYVKGAPGYSTVSPQGYHSTWKSSRMDDLHQTLHFYFTQEDLAKYAVEVLDVEPLSLELSGVIFDDNQIINDIARACILPLNWSEKSDQMALSSAIQLLIYQIVKNYVDSSKFVKASHKGGLTLTVQKRVKEYIEAHLDSAMTIESLAEVAGLSTFHFARMFHKSFGVTPHTYLKERKIKLAKDLLVNHDMPLIDIAVASGYCSPSHFSRQFKSMTKLTPSQYRSLNSDNRYPSLDGAGG